MTPQPYTFVTRTVTSSLFSCINLHVCYANCDVFPLFVYQLHRLLRELRRPPSFRVSTYTFVTRTATSSLFSCINFLVCYTNCDILPLFVYQLPRLLRELRHPPSFRVSTSPFVTRTATSSLFSCINFHVCYTNCDILPLFVYQLTRLLHELRRPPSFRVSTSTFVICFSSHPSSLPLNRSLSSHDQLVGKINSFAYQHIRSTETKKKWSDSKLSDHFLIIVD